MITFDLGCKAGQVDINCTNSTWHGTPSNMSEWGPRWFPRFGAWFDALKAKYPSLLWINNGPYPGDGPERAAFRGMGAWARKTMQGRMIEPHGEQPDNRGLLTSYEMAQPISRFMQAVEEWTDPASGTQPAYVSAHMAVPHTPRDHVGLWQNAVRGAGDMMRMGTEFQPMRFGLGCTLLTDGYFANSLITGAFYGVPTWYAEYEADLGYPTGDARLLLNGTGVGQVWTRPFERGLVVVNGQSDRNFSYELPAGHHYSNLQPSKRPHRITGGYEAPLVQFVIDNEAPFCGVMGPRIDWGPTACSFVAHEDLGLPPPPPPAAGCRNCSASLRQAATDCEPPQCTLAHQLTGIDNIDACCQRCLADLTCTGWVWDTLHDDPTTRGANCWLLSGPIETQKSIPERVFGRVGAAPPAASSAWPISAGLHQVGKNFLTSVIVDGSDWINQPVHTATWGFRAPTSGAYRFSASRVTSTNVPLTNAAKYCMREASNRTGGCLGEGTVDQRHGGGGWVLIMAGVPLRAGQMYEMVLMWDTRQGGFAAADAILIESEAVLNDGAQLDTPTLVVPPLDARIVKIDT